MEVPQEFVPVLLVQIALFLGLWMVLKRVWFDPALKILAAREARSHGAIAEAKVVRAEVDRLRREHAAALEQVKSEAQREVQEILRQGEVEQRRLLGEASDAAQRTMNEARERIAGELSAAREQLRGDIDTIAREVARTVMGRAV